MLGDSRQKLALGTPLFPQLIAPVRPNGAGQVSPGQRPGKKISASLSPERARQLSRPFRAASALPDCTQGCALG